MHREPRVYLVRIFCRQADAVRIYVLPTMVARVCIDIHNRHLRGPSPLSFGNNYRAFPLRLTLRHNTGAHHFVP